MEASRPDTATFSIDDLLEHMVALGASDLHVSTGSAPVIRLNGRLRRIEEFPRLTPDDTQRLLYRILSTEQPKLFSVFEGAPLPVTLSEYCVVTPKKSISGLFGLIPAP